MLVLLLAACSATSEADEPPSTSTEPAAGTVETVPSTSAAASDSAASDSTLPATTTAPIAGDGSSTVAWWYADPCGSDDPCVPPDGGGSVPAGDVRVVAAAGECPVGAVCDLQDAIDGAPPGAVIAVEGVHGGVEVDREDVTLVGDGCCATVESLRVDGPGLVLRGLVVDTVVLGPEADGALIAWSRVGQVFVNGADAVSIVGNVMRPSEPGPDVIQVKTFDEDEPTDLVIEGNVIGPQPSAGDSHTDCIQVLGGDRVTVARNVILPCGDKALQLRSGAGGELGAVVVEGNAILECREKRPGCEGFHAIIWASTERSSLVLRHNTIRGSVGLSSTGSTEDPGDNFAAVGNIVATMPCTEATVDNLTVDDPPCGGRGVQAPFPAFRDDAEEVGDLRPVDPDALPRAAAAYGPDLLGSGPCPSPAVGALTGCP